MAGLQFVAQDVSLEVARIIMGSDIRQSETMYFRHDIYSGLTYVVPKGFLGIDPGVNPNITEAVRAIRSPMKFTADLGIGKKMGIDFGGLATSTLYGTFRTVNGAPHFMPVYPDGPTAKHIIIFVLGNRKCPTVRLSSKKCPFSGDLLYHKRTIGGDTFGHRSYWIFPVKYVAPDKFSQHKSLPMPYSHWRDSDDPNMEVSDDNIWPK